MSLPRSFARSAGDDRGNSSELRSLDKDLPDRVEAGVPGIIRVWEPRTAAVVLGRSNASEREARPDVCEKEGVPVLRRLGGGGAVVLGPGCLVVSLARLVEESLVIGPYMEKAVGILAAAIREVAGVATEPRGTGDLCVGDRKILGSSVFRRRRVFFYQASLLVSMDLRLVDRYLRHPSREPEYRRGRPHGEFLTTLRAAGCEVPMVQLAAGIEGEVSRRLEEIG
jgi:lipoate-protein ligase A